MLGLLRDLRGHRPEVRRSGVLLLGLHVADLVVNRRDFGRVLHVLRGNFTVVARSHRDLGLLILGLLWHWLIMLCRDLLRDLCRNLMVTLLTNLSRHLLKIWLNGLLLIITCFHLILTRSANYGLNKLRFRLQV